MTHLNRKFCVAPMLDWTDQHCRYLMRSISSHALLYSEMVTTGALIHGDKNRHLDFNAEEHPLALQLGGSNPNDLALCSKIAEDWGYDEINLNCGCPSDRVQSGQFGASLMAEPQRVADCLKAMSDAVSIPVTLKCRIGIDDMEGYQPFRDFIDIVSNQSNCSTIIIHARKAWLHGLSPKDNRSIPPLHYDYVYRLKQELPHLDIIINGGINSLEQGLEHLNHVDGVMMGREAYQNPFILADVDSLFFNSNKPSPSRDDICQEYIEYSTQKVNSGTKLHHLTRHILGLYQQVPGAKNFRRFISENAHKPDAGAEILEEALAYIAP